MAVKRAKKASGAESYFVYYQNGRWGGRSESVHVFRVTSIGPKRITGERALSAVDTWGVETRISRDMYDPPLFDSFDKAALVCDRINTAMQAQRDRHNKLEACARAFNAANWSSEMHFRALIDAEVSGRPQPAPSAWLRKMFDLAAAIDMPVRDDEED